jgi:hypothetical protein
MSDYDFHQLSPYDFEVFVRDLLQAHWKVTVESFKAGRDGGIDLRYARAGHKVIVQVKHFARTGLAGLLREMKTEATKVQTLKPDRYVVVTSVPLSPANKDDLVKIVGPSFLNASDVFGREDLNNLLGLNKQIEDRHYKLWLASRAVLDRVLHNAAATRSEFKARQVHIQARRYVQGASYPVAAKVLQEQRVVVISGPPGIGKSTLANLLLYEHLERGFQAVVIQKDIREAEGLFQEGTPQIFYFDDFMGATFLGERNPMLADGSDRALLDFIAMVRARPDARLVLTTREHIYQQAMGRSERLRASELDDLRVFLSMPSYDLRDRGLILYNHLYFSDLPTAYRDELLRGDFYLVIVKHKKFNPRLIEWLSTFRRLQNVPVAAYRSFVVSLLRDPSEIWRHAYEQEISNAGRSMLLTVFSLGGKTLGATLKSAFSALHAVRASHHRFETRPEDFSTALREVNGAFIKPDGAHGIGVIDASVLDLLNSVVSTAPTNAIDIAVGAVTFAQIEALWSFAKTDRSGGIVNALRDELPRVAASIRKLMIVPREFIDPQGRVHFRGSSFESRLVVVVEMFREMGGVVLQNMIEELSTKLIANWKLESLDVTDAVDALRVLNTLQGEAKARFLALAIDIKGALESQVNAGCRSDELKALIDVLDLAGADSGAVPALRAGFAKFLGDGFRDDVLECRSVEQYDALLEDLKLFQKVLGVDVGPPVGIVQLAKSEHMENEEAYADHMQDEWKERYRDERDDERSLSEIFGSLAGARE